MFNPAPIPAAAFPWFALAFGLVIGSFANVCILRIPRGESVVTPRSRCPHCHAGIASWDNIPVLSYLFLGARCRSCRAPISIRYPLIEALAGGLYFGVVALHGLNPRAIVLLVFVTALLVLSLIDLEHQLLPDVITLPGVALGLLASILLGIPPPADAFLSALAGYLAFMWIARGWERLRGIEALGQGDWKLAAMLGAFLGWEQLLFTILVASLAGTLVGLALIVFKGRSFQHRLPLGTFLGAAGIIAVFVGDPLVRWYQHFLEV